ncbi:hypothetical protein [Erythrobacter sp. JK5]|uniref:hypothetical protein n=1 Tax=Erythrobacter sp. JK5 TaxID=2829500 RepID=UPI001BA885F9|nr:hypothetical protein [Erythrobacter sp. JK5]QUL38585.1 hypothetical protein KDC96_04085 [Erythrobacter sp. JK5]
MTLTETAYAEIGLAFIAAVLLAGCAPAEEAPSVASADEACERTIATLVAERDYPADQMTGCDGWKSEEPDGFYVLRVNGYCHDPKGCGSVLMGWYAVEASTGAVYDWDVGEMQIGQRIDQKR